jgi:transcriptional regulator with XRE-family HTH domain
MDRAGLAPLDPRESARLLGASIARLRHEKGLTGRELGRLVGISQAKLSKIETGAIEPSPQDVQKLAHALNAPEEVVEDLADRANALQDKFTGFRLTTTRLTSLQEEVARDEERANRIAVFQHAIVPGLLQTAEYARAVLSDAATVLSGNEPGLSQPAPPSAVSLRVQRQEVLYDRRRRFDFVIAEGVLTRAMASPAVMLAQLDRIRTVGAQDNVTVAILPSDAELEIIADHGFHLFDDQFVIIDLLSTVVVLRDPEDVRVYRTALDHVRGRATTDIDPILDRYALRYADLARAAVQHG